MESISVERRSELLRSARTILKLELRDNYDIDADTFSAWRAGRSIKDAVSVWGERAAARVAAGVVTRRVKIVSEPLSDYHRFILEASKPAIDAGEDMRWLPRRLVSTVPLPGNDFFVLAGKTVIFNVFGGDDRRAEIQLSQDPEVVKLCVSAFDTAWALAIPHGEYRAGS
ncbi:MULTISPECIES: DUF6879 family protein [Actinomadura]|uniref:DUF6879 family protein n=1 Tax=Actinomadura yumaensis TaxID=111807 RepID=A0ABW2CS66_9ACTN|nr:DUF6879 family protein [Actinomadura sp. J1-007]MWK34149.1 hypothetical protein [Actinomadura sp. J1-007]